MQGDFTPFSPARPVSPIAYPVSWYRHLDLVLAVMDDLKGLDAVCLGFHVLLDDIEPASTANVYPCAPVCYTEEIRFALNETDWKTMHRKNVQGLEGHCVVAAKHILIA